MAVRRTIAALSIALLAEADDSSLVWRTVHTPHFVIHYYQPLEDVAQRVARRAERAHDILSPLLAHDPERTHIVLLDDTDSANGFASPLPYNQITAFVTAPEALSELGDFDDWLFDLILHEYTHIVHLDTIHGLPRIYNWVFGKTLSWNLVQPRWFIEGLAVHEETAHTSSGRGRSSLMHMMLRAQVLENRFMTLDQITSSPRAFPRGTVAYLYGGHFLGYLADRFGESALREISHDYGGGGSDTWFLPFALNRTVRRATGKDYVTLYREFYGHIRARYEHERDQVRARGETPTHRLTFQGWQAAHPRFLPDGRILFFQSDGTSHAALRSISAAGGPVEEITRVWSGTRPSVTRDGRKLVFDQTSVWRTFYSYSDLYLYDLDRAHLTRLTQGLRARDPDLSPDGREIAFSLNGEGSSSLARMALDTTGTAKAEVLIQGRQGSQVYTPSWSPDGKTIAYSGFELGGYRDVFLYDVATASTRRLWRDRALDLDPRFSSDGKTLFFSSDRTGIYQIYAYDLAEGQLAQVTNVVNGAFQPEPSPDGKTLAFIGFSSNGYDVHEIDLDRARWLEAQPYRDRRPPPPVISSVQVYPDEPYRPLMTFYPRSWELGLFTLPTVVEARTSFSDAIGRHRAALAFGWRPETDRLSFAARYSNHRLWPTLTLAGGRTEGPSSELILDGQRHVFHELRSTATAAAALPIVRIPEHSANLTLQYRYNDFENTQPELYTPDPGDISPRFPNTGALAGVAMGLAYDGRRRYAWSISPEESRRIALVLRANHEALGSDYRTTQLTYSWSEFFANPWLDHHVLSLRWEGGIGKGDPARQGLFALGGFGEQDFIGNLLNLQFFGGTPLRGYPPGAFIGDQYVLLNAEYRFPIVDIDRGVTTYPLYFRYLHGAVFSDWGGAFFGALAPEKLHPSLGFELRLEFWLAYVLPLAARVGYAHGLDPEGVDEIIVILGGGF